MMRGTTENLETYAIKVNPDTTYVYPVRAWEDYSWRNANPNEYWNSGITLTEWFKRDDLNGSEWEVLFRPEDIIGVPKRVSRKRLLDATSDNWKSELEDNLKKYKIR